MSDAGERASLTGLLFPGNPLAALVFEERLGAAGASISAVYVEFPGGLPTWFVHPADPGSEHQLRALGRAQVGRVPFLPPPEAVTVQLTHGSGSVEAEGATLALALSAALGRLSAAPGDQR